MTGLGKDALCNQCFTQFDAKRVINLKDVDRDASDCRAANEVGTFPAEMGVPFVASRVE